MGSTGTGIMFGSSLSADPSSSSSSSSSFTQTFLRGILTSIDSRDPVVANAWLETLLDAIDLLPVDVIRQEIVVIAVAKSQLSQPPFSRIAACKILGKLATKLEPVWVRAEILPATLALCQAQTWTYHTIIQQQCSCSNTKQIKGCGSALGLMRIPDPDPVLMRIQSGSRQNFNYGTDPCGSGCASPNHTFFFKKK